MRRGFAIAIVFLGMFLVVAAFAALTVPSLAAQLVGIVERLPQTQAQIADQLQRHRQTAPLAQSVRGTESTALTGKARAGSARVVDGDRRARR